ncbi:HAD family hydrolase [Corynebacterium alimapuense]|uniref:HAD family hydrolase n=1 Tax=Corynebacterium alimapuense TaxID=1576874 RepID=A0A3M8K9W3_9CORY|nr:HAD family hydrolase [Corynebacterium alimapuense]RNE50001.1 HAD family hydrolase [Corynebacterium alimapuense]
MTVDTEHAPTLIASDVDGTLLDSRERVTPRVRDAVIRAVRSGAEVALATGRPHRWIYPVLDQLPIRPVCVTANGAVLYDSANDRVLRAHVLEPETMESVLGSALEAFHSYGGVAIGCERAGSSALDAEEEMFLTSPNFLHTWEGQGFGVVPAHEVIAEPAVKLILRNERLSASEMYDLISPFIDPMDAHVTFSMDEGLLEVAAPGVTKALGVSTLAQLHGLEQKDVLCFGDMPNDIEMLQWAGFGVAMGNARTSVKQAADYVTGTNDDSGVAQVLERWF